MRLKDITDEEIHALRYSTMNATKLLYGVVIMYQQENPPLKDGQPQATIISVLPHEHFPDDLNKESLIEFRQMNRHERKKLLNTKKDRRK
jgi:hypothetical protein